jgi:hypothetical protein
MRERRRRGIIAVVPVEILATDLAVFVRARLMEQSEAETRDRHALSAAVHELLNRWTQFMVDRSTSPSAPSKG